jgi:hypothetical protein
MPGSPRSGSLVFVACALLAGGGCTPGGGEPSCATDSDCPWNARCVASACVANAAPVPVLVVPTGQLETGVLHSFDASGSHDPDDEVASWAWSVRSVDAPCPPPVLAASEPIAQARFACAGRYAIDVTVTDQLGVTSTTTVEVEVIPYSGAPLVASGPDLAIEHECSTLPTRCAPAGAVTLEAVTPGFADGSVAIEWTVEPPPNRPLDASRRVTFTPSRFVRAPSVLIETDGQAISGDWIFHLRVSDAAGVIGTASTRVSVKNRPPVVAKTLPAPDHAFDGARFTASGEIPFTITDPDGDQLVGPFVEWRHAGDGAGGAFAGELLDDPQRVTFSISVPYAKPEDALHLIGGVGLERTIAFTVSDVNGATTAETWPITVRNRAPALVSAPASVHRDHWYDAATATYRAEVPLSSWRDPDGDPLFQTPTADTGSPRCGAITIPFDAAEPSAARIAVASCGAPFLGTPAAGQLTGTHTIKQVIQDPWTAATDPSTVSVTIGNRAPIVTPAGDHVVAGQCAPTSTCCEAWKSTCLTYGSDAAAVVSVVPTRWEDPDGDPLEISAPVVTGPFTPALPLVCLPQECAPELTISAASVCGSLRMSMFGLVSDGVDITTFGLFVERRCGP